MERVGIESGLYVDLLFQVNDVWTRRCKIETAFLYLVFLFVGIQSGFNMQKSNL